MDYKKMVYDCVKYCFDEENVRKYSGRFMYGKYCLGFVTDNPITSILEIIERVLERYGEDEDAIYEVIGLLKKNREDSMGRSQIVYFPEIEWNDEYMEEYVDNDE